MMHYWHLLWDWNSLDSMRQAHRFFELAAIIFFALLMLFDVLAHLAEDTNKNRARYLERIGLVCFGIAIMSEVITYEYSKKNDALSSNEIRSLGTISNKARLDAADAVRSAKDAKALIGTAVDDSHEATKSVQQVSRDALVLKSTIGALSTKASRIEQQLAWRDIDEDATKRIARRLTPFAGQLFDMTALDTDPESVNFENEVYRVALRGRWTVDPNRKWHTLLVLFSGVQITIANAATENTRSAARALVDALTAESIVASLKRGDPTDTWPASNVVAIQVGKSPNSMQPMIPQ
jgi:hypothetical protein